jgi:hypothetical protein
MFEYSSIYRLMLKTYTESLDVLFWEECLVPRNNWYNEPGHCCLLLRKNLDFTTDRWQHATVLRRRNLRTENESQCKGSEVVTAWNRDWSVLVESGTVCYGNTLVRPSDSICTSLLYPFLHPHIQIQPLRAVEAQSIPLKLTWVCNSEAYRVMGRGLFKIGLVAWCLNHHLQLQSTRHTLQS